MASLEPSKVCRCCLSADQAVFQMIDVIFNSMGPESEMTTALEVYFEFTALNMGMVLDTSLQICLNCQTQLQTVFSFRKKCLESHDFLLHVKEEFQEDIVCEEFTIPDIKIEVFGLESPKKEKPERKLKTKKVIEKKIKKTAVLKADGPKKLKTTAVDFVRAKFVCFKCDKEMLNYAHLVKHYTNHLNPVYKNRDCNLCGDRAVADYEQHLIAAHPEYRPQQCLTCPENFVNYKDLKQHLLTHQTEESVECQACSTKCKSMFSLRMHIANNCGRPKGPKTEYNCHICGQAADTVQAVMQHIYDKHPRDFAKRYFICFHCKRLLMGSHGRQTVCAKCLTWQKKRNKQMADENIAPTYHCEKCKRGFYEAEEYACHQFGYHSTRAFCYLCEMPFWTREEYRVHRIALHKNKPLPRKMCDECGKVFHSNSELRDHILIAHTGLRQFKCAHPDCDKKFATKKVAMSHYRHVHIKHFSYECHYCGKKMNEHNYILIHMARAHFPHMKKYECTVEGCSKRFASVTDRRSHLQVHRPDTN